MEHISTLEQIVPQSLNEYLNKDAHETYLLYAPIELCLIYGCPEWILKQKLKSGNIHISVDSFLKIIRNNDIKTIQFILHNVNKIDGLSDDYEKWFRLLFQSGNEVIVRMMVDAVQSDVIELSNDDKFTLVRMTIDCDTSLAIRNAVDACWYIAPDDQKSTILEFYKNILEYPSIDGYQTDIIRVIFKTGITRHMETFKNRYNGTLPEENRTPKPETFSTSGDNTHCITSSDDNDCLGLSNDQFVKESLNTIMSNVETDVSGEADLIKESVTELMRIYANILREHNTDGLLKCTPKLVGSGAEGTRCKPDEFDFKLIFERLSDYFDVSYNKLNYEGKITCKPGLERTTSDENPVLKAVISNDEFDNVVWNTFADKTSVFC